MDGGVLTRHETGFTAGCQQADKSSPPGGPGRTISFPNDTSAAGLLPSRSPSLSSRTKAIG